MSMVIFINELVCLLKAYEAYLELIIVGGSHKFPRSNVVSLVPSSRLPGLLACWLGLENPG